MTGGPLLGLHEAMRASLTELIRAILATRMVRGELRQSRRLPGISFTDGSRLRLRPVAARRGPLLALPKKLHKTACVLFPITLVVYSIIVKQ